MSAILAGYKQTEVGVIPTDWSDLAFSHLYAESSRNGIYKTAEFHGRGTRIVNMGEMFGFEFISDQEMCRVELTNRELSVCTLQDGDLLFGRRSVVPAGAGKCSLVVSPPESITFESSIIRVRLDKAKVCPRFYYYFFASPAGRSVVGTIVSGTNVKGIRATELGELTIPLPTKAEQEAIAEALSDADALIESLEQLLAKKRHLKQGAMQELLTGKKRLPGFSGEWDATRLGDIADPDQKWSFTGGPFGSNLKSSDYTDAGVRIIQLQNIGDGQFHNDYSVFTSVEKADELLSCNIYPGEIILSKMGDPVARACIIPPLHERYLMCSDGIRLAVNPKRFNAYFVFLVINAPDFRRRAENAGTGSTRKRIGLNELRNLELSCPKLHEQNAISAILADMDSEIATLEADLTKTRALKQGMMQKLLTGEIRLI